MLELPVHPRLSRLLLASAESGRLRDGATIAALLSEKDILIRDTGPFPQRDPSRAETSADSDVLIRLDRLRRPSRPDSRPPSRSRRNRPNLGSTGRRGDRDELIRLVGRGEMKGHGGDEDRDDLLILKAMLLAYPDRLVKRRGVEGTRLMVGGRGVRARSGFRRPGRRSLPGTRCARGCSLGPARGPGLPGRPRPTGMARGASARAPEFDGKLAASTRYATASSAPSNSGSSTSSYARMSPDRPGQMKPAGSWPTPCVPRRRAVLPRRASNRGLARPG